MTWKCYLKGMGKHIGRIIPVVLLITFILVIYLTDLHNYLTLDNLKKEQSRLEGYVDAHPFTSPLLYMGIYILSVIFVIPDSTVLTILGGMVFPLPLAFLYAIFSEVVGALIFFAIFHGAFGKTFIAREKPLIHKTRKELEKHPASYLLFVRLSHVIPFWFINLSAAYFRVHYWTFIWTCIVGVLPLTYLLAEAGHTISDVFAKPGIPTISDVFTVQMKLLFLLIGLLAFLPLLIQKWRKKRKKWWKR